MKQALSHRPVMPAIAAKAFRDGSRRFAGSLLSSVVNDQYMFRPDLRRAVIFGRHDLVQDAPISRLDLLVCRNTLMYFNAETQTRILDRFHFALKDSGVLFLGKAEMLLTHGNLFTPINLQHRVFRPVPTPNRRERVLSLAPTIETRFSNSITQYVQLREAALEAVRQAQLVG
jgi:two-component system CheB/CheR fusion protein